MNHDSLPRPRWFARLLLVGVGLLILLRFVHLDADFPLGVAGSGALYTDEGWYANAATRHFLTGHWYAAGDFNPAINMPIGQVLHRGVFAMLGLSLASARLSEALAFVVVIVAIAQLVRRSFGPGAGVLTALILASNYLGFAYSRLAVMEPVAMAFVALGLLLGDRAREGRAGLRLILAGVMVTAAVLVKGTMIIAIPLIAYFAWHSEGTRRRRAVWTIFCVLLPLAAVQVYQWIARGMFPGDYAFFIKTNLSARMVGSGGEFLLNVRNQILEVPVVGKGFLTVSIPLILAALFLPRFRRSSLVHVLLGYVFLYFGLLTIVRYGPSRYFLPFLIPFSGLAAIACVELERWIGERGHRGLIYAPCLLVGLIVGFDAFRIGAYMLHPHYTFVQMSHGIRQIIQEREGSMVGVIVVGNFADSIALEAGMRAMNTEMAVAPLEERLERERPGYVITHVDEAPLLKRLQSKSAKVSRLGAWDVYANYYGNGENVELFGIDWSQARSTR